MCFFESLRVGAFSRDHRTRVCICWEPEYREQMRRVAVAAKLVAHPSCMQLVMILGLSPESEDRSWVCRRRSLSKSVQDFRPCIACY
jgi:hypothetical protein